MRLRFLTALGAFLPIFLPIARAAAPVSVLVDPSTYVLIRPTSAQLAAANNLGGGGGGGSYIFTAADFNESGSTISLDFTNAQKATTSLPGFLSAADWTTFNAKAPTASPTFTGTPLAPTAAVDTNTTQLATTGFVIGQGYLKSSTAASTYQGLDSDLTSIAALATTSFGRSLLTQSSAATVRAALDLEAGTDFLAYPSGTPTGSKFLRDDNTWVAIAGGGDALIANPLSQFAATTSAQLAGVLSDEEGASGGFVRSGYLGTAATQASSAFQAADGDLTTYANITPSANVQSLLGAADYSAMRTQLSLVPGTNVQAYDADLTTYAGITPSANIQTFLGAASYSAMRTQLGLVISTDVQAYDSDLTTWGAVTPGSGVTTFLATPSSANLAAAVTGETGTGALVFNSDPILLSPNSAMGALAVDVTKKRNTKSISADSTLTFSATPSAGTIFGLRLTNSDSAVHTITIPSSFSYWRGTITSFVIPASSTVELSWDYDGTTYYIAGDPVTFNDLTTATPVAGDLVPFYDVSGAVDGKATIANLISPQIGVTVQAYDADLTTYAGITPSANVQSILSGANYAAIRALLDLESGTDFLAYPTGTPTGSKYLRDDNTWQTVSGSSAPTVNAQTGTTYTLVLGDANNIVTMSNGSANTLTIPPNSSVAFATGTIIQVQQGGAGATTFDPGVGVTMNGATSNVTLSEQYEWATLVKLGTDAWGLSYMAGPGTGSVTSVAASVPAFLSISGSPITTSGTLAISYSGTALPVANGGTGITAFGTGVATAMGSNTNGAGGLTTTDGTKTLTNTTLDASATGNVLKQYGYMILTHPTVFGSGVTQQTTVTSPLYGQALFSNSADKATNYVEYILTVPDDIDTAVDLTGKFKFILGGADANDHEYEISMIDVAGSAVYDTALADAVSLTYTADGSGADKDIQTAGAPDTLTGWAAALAAGNYWRIRVARDGDHASDTSTVNSYSGPLIIRYGTTQ
jgi:hypothetical protein